MTKVVLTSALGAVFWSAVMPDLISSVVVSCVWGFASGVFWAQQDYKTQEAKRCRN